MKLLWQQIPSPIITEIFCSSSFDGVVLDLEHGHFNNETLYSCIQVGTLLNKAVLARFSHLDKQVMRMVLDAGISGVILSTVESTEQAKEFYDYCIYPCNGKRGQGLVRENLWGMKPLELRKPIIIPQIETVTGVENIERISDINFDYYLVGPYDLSASLGAVGDFESLDFRRALEYLKNNVGDKLGFHIPCDVKDKFKDYKDYNFLALGMDTTFIIENIKDIEYIINPLNT